MFKKLRAAQTEAKEAKFKEPRVRSCKNRDTHTAEHSPLTRIVLLARIPAKRRTMYRCIIKIPQDDLDQSIYIICDVLLRTILDDTSIDRLFYPALGRILRSPKSAAVKEMCADYLLAQLAIDTSYTSLLEYLLRHCSAVLIPKKSALLERINDPRLRKSVGSLREQTAAQKLIYTDPIYYLR